MIGTELEYTQEYNDTNMYFIWMIHIRKSAMINYIYGNQRDTGETEVADIVSAEGYGCNGVDPLPIGESGGSACRIPSF